jgi:hypothetical protein
MTAPSKVSTRIPLLCAGDRLTRDEFERRYAALPHCKKAELIEGVVCMPSPVGVYRRSGVREYLVYRVDDADVDWFVLEADQVLRSRVFPGLWLDVAGLLRGDARSLHACLERGLASAEHARFLAGSAREG